MVSGENYYLNYQQRKAKTLNKMKGVVINVVAWNRTPPSATSTREILIGSNKGIIYETEIEPGEQGFFREREKYFKQVYNLSKESVQPVTGLQLEEFPGARSAAGETKYFVIATTPTRIYQFVGVVSAGEVPVFAPFFANYEINPSFHDMPGDLDDSSSCLDFWSERGGGRMQSFAWLTGPGIYFGGLQFGSQNAGEQVMTDTRLLPYAGFENGDPQVPLSLVVTEFHVVLLFADHLEATCLLNDRVVYDDFVPSRRFGPLKALAMDAQTHTVWAYTATTLFELVVTEEERDVWTLYLERKQWDNALKYCKDNPAKRDTVLTAQADYYFERGTYSLAAGL